MRYIAHAINWPYLLSVTAALLVALAFPACCVLWLLCIL